MQLSYFCEVVGYFFGMAESQTASFLPVDAEAVFSLAIKIEQVA